MRGHRGIGLAEAGVEQGQLDCKRDLDAGDLEALAERSLVTSLTSPVASPLRSTWVGVGVLRPERS